MGEWSMLLADGTLAGSTLTMDPAPRHLAGLAFELADAATATVTPSLVASWARVCSLDPDHPHHLSKLTKTS